MDTKLKTNKGKRDLVKRLIRRQKIELIVAFIGYVIGIGIAVWSIVQIFLIQTR